MTGKHLKQLMDTAGIKGAELGRRAGFADGSAKSRVSAYVKNRKRITPAVETLFKILIDQYAKEKVNPSVTK